MTQKEALDILKTGRNVFLTGAAGSGKTFVLREYIKYLRGINAEIGITASTGIAATHMGGMTIHSWAGIGIKDWLSKDEVREMMGKHRLGEKLKNASVLIIDEISMLHHFRLDLLDMILKEARSSLEPFGGMQVVLCGDFFQLPPVHRAGEREALFAYHSDIWKSSNLKICYLSEQHRQNDLKYMDVLNAIRSNNPEKEMMEILKTRLDKKPGREEAGVTRLYSHNKNVDYENESELSSLPGNFHEYYMEERGRHNMVLALKKSCLAPETLRLKLGAKVMFVKNNFEEGYVNGTLGVVEKCGYEEIKVRTLSGETIDVNRESWRIEEDGRSLAEISQYPLRLAWAITIHKSQGMSLDAAEIDLRSSFEKGMGYVALSRVRSLEGLYLKGFNDLALKVNEEVFEYDKKLRKLSDTSSFHINTMGREKILGMHEAFREKVEVKSKNSKKKKTKIDTVTQTKTLLEKGESIKDIAKERGLKPGTIIEHIEEIKKGDPKFNIYNLKNSIPGTKFKNIYSAFRKVGLSEDGIYRLAPVKELLGPKFSYEDIRLVRLFL